MSAQDARARISAAELGRDWRMVGLHLDRARSVSPDAGMAEAALVALSLDHAYQAFESMLVRLERMLELPPRLGGEWHRALLADAALDVPGLRPAIVPAEALRDWFELLGFRHFLRHAYTVDLDGAKLARNVDCLERAMVASDPAVLAVIASLAAPSDD